MAVITCNLDVWTHIYVYVHIHMYVCMYAALQYRAVHCCLYIPCNLRILNNVHVCIHIHVIFIRTYVCMIFMFMYV